MAETPRMPSALSAATNACSALIQRLIGPQQRPTEGNSESSLKQSRQGGLEVSESDCAGAEHVPSDSALSVMRDTWDPALRTRLLFIRCVQRSHCLPFVIRVRNSFPQSNGGNRAEKSKSTITPAKPLMRSGQRATLIWQQGGIRSVVPVICLDHGSVGERVRVRVAQGSGTIVFATVVSSSELLKKS